MARSLFRRRPCVDTGYPKYGLRTDLTGSCGDWTVEGVTIVWSSDRVSVGASRDCCSGYAGSSRFTSEGRVPPKSMSSYEVLDVLSNEDVYLVVKPKV